MFVSSIIFDAILPKEPRYVKWLEIQKWQKGQRATLTSIFPYDTTVSYACVNEALAFNLHNKPMW